MIITLRVAEIIKAKLTLLFYMENHNLQAAFTAFAVVVVALADRSSIQFWV